MISNFDNFLFFGMFGTRSFSLANNSCISSATMMSAGDDDDEADDEEREEEAAKCIFAFVTLFTDKDFDLGDREELLLLAVEVDDEVVLVISRQRFL